MCSTDHTATCGILWWQLKNFVACTQGRNPDYITCPAAFSLIFHSSSVTALHLSTATFCSVCCLQGALMAKAIAVAVLGDEVLMPRGYRHSGLVWIYVAICGSIPAQGGLWWAADSFITGVAGRAAQLVQLQEQLLCCSALCTTQIPCMPPGCSVSRPAIGGQRHLNVLLSAQAAHQQHRRHPSLPFLSPLKQHICSASALFPVQVWLTPTASTGLPDCRHAEGAGGSSLLGNRQLLSPAGERARLRLQQHRRKWQA